MAVNVSCNDPGALLRAVKSAINDGTVATWSVDADGDLTHTPEQWRKKAWFRPTVGDERLVFNILAPRGTTMSKALYGVYHGRLIEMLLAHFDTKFTRASATALATSADVIASQVTSS